MYFEPTHPSGLTAFSAFTDPPPKALELFGDETFDHYEEHEAQIRAFTA